MMSGLRLSIVGDDDEYWVVDGNAGLGQCMADVRMSCGMMGNDDDIDEDDG
jgi:hypothetical protein